MITRAKHPDLPRWQIIKQQHPDHRDNRNGQRRIKQPVTQAGRAGGSLLLGALVIATQPDAAKTGNQRQRDDGNADGNIDRALVVHPLISPVAKQEQQTIEPPEQAGGQATRVAFVAPGHDRDHQQNDARQPVEPGLLKIHATPPFACAAAFSLSSSRCR